MARKTFKRKHRKNFRKRNMRSMVRIRTPTAFPDAIQCKLNYSELTAHTSALGAKVTTQWRGNSVYDPRFAIGGHQPLGMDQYSLLYRSFLVKGMKWEIDVISDGGAGSFVHQVATICKPIDTITPLISTVREKPYSQYKVMGLQGSSRHIIKFKGYMSTKKMVGLKKLNVENVAYTGSTDTSLTSDPPLGWNLQLYMQPLTGTATFDYEVQCRLTYYVTFFNRRQLLQST